MPECSIKICGLSTPETVDAAVDAGATHVGLVHLRAEPAPCPLEKARRSARARVPSESRSCC